MLMAMSLVPGNWPCSMGFWAVACGKGPAARAAVGEGCAGAEARVACPGLCTCTDVVYLDAKHDTYLEEVSSCNVFAV